ncbi:MEDS domain-containing protein [Nocardioides sp. SR21]|uniref:MEDS domain-containing protein n=1 Tax=Nocardioides sp. SR21 TaxID=2919501 RepID=UPI001FA9F422|nr:MEDS domain-containing protein [Nocardioides sp. SR21]
MSGFHDVLMFASDQELADGTRELIEAGVMAGDLVLVVGDQQELGVLRDAWDDDPRITFTHRDEVYEHPMRTIAEYQRLLDRERENGAQLRVTGPVPFGEDARRRRGWMIYEALIDRAFAAYPFRSLCQYDTRTTPNELVEHARETHERIFSRTDVSPGNGRGAEVLAELTRADAADVVESGPVVYADVLTGVGDLSGFRAAMRTAPESLVFAANEIAANALVHGSPPVDVRLRKGAEDWQCVVSDRGPGLLDPYAGIDSPLHDELEVGGRGLWLARQACDRLTITADPGTGTTVRLEHRV